MKFKFKIASTENLCIGIWKELFEPIKQNLKCELFCIKIMETLCGLPSADLLLPSSKIRR